ncbi:MAG TPA: NAD(+) kinase [Lachnospiraceae bacterium]|nr:NAD(+) kinase [Lachnospiraceae bacterium]
MNSFYVITNHSKESACKEALYIKNYLAERGKICYLQEDGVKVRSNPLRYTDASKIPEDVECAIALGGDGTLLHASRDLVDTSLPLLGVNLGTLGYLAEIEHTSIAQTLDRLIADDYFIENRMMLQGTVESDSGEQRKDIALNDIVISRRGRLRVVDFNVYVNDVFLCSYRADGIIVSTPTGSTGYSLSAGGPIVSPDASLILLTAIAPHTLISRTIVLPDHVVVSVEVGQERFEEKGGAEASFDGDTFLVPGKGGRIVISKSEKVTHLIKMNHTSFVKNLREKLK